jgi:hypothetical protein
MPVAPLGYSPAFHPLQTFGMLFATLLMLQPGIGRIPMPDTVFGEELTTLVAFLLATPLLAWDFFQRGRPPQSYTNRPERPGRGAAIQAYCATKWAGASEVDFY